jgi:hypothetical protein
MALTAVGASTPTLAKFDSKSDKGRWNFKRPLRHARREPDGDRLRWFIFSELVAC